MQKIKARRSVKIKMVYEKLHNAIVKGEIKPGERILEEDISKKLNVSRTPVRLALNELSKLNLISITPYKGAVVTYLSPHEAQEIIEVCALLDQYLCRSAAQSANLEQLCQLKNNLDNF